MRKTYLNKAVVAFMLLFITFNVITVFAQTTKTVAQWVALAKSGEKKLKGANFTGANLAGVNLQGADLSGANLTGTNLGSANLTDCKLYNCNLTGVNFTDANLTRANFLATNMQYVNMRNANLTQALLQEADLKYAILNGANLQSANLLLANLEGADLQNANLTNTMLDYNPNATPIKTLPIPEIVESEAVGKALDAYETNKDAFIKLKGAKINGGTKGLDIAWAKKHGVIAPMSKTTSTQR
jgi:hypothetical protein